MAEYESLYTCSQLLATAPMICNRCGRQLSLFGVRCYMETFTRVADFLPIGVLFPRIDVFPVFFCIFVNWPHVKSIQLVIGYQSAGGPGTCETALIKHRFVGLFIAITCSYTTLVVRISILNTVQFPSHLWQNAMQSWRNNLMQILNIEIIYISIPQFWHESLLVYNVWFSFPTSLQVWLTLKKCLVRCWMILTKRSEAH